jgi:hypothetical protein
MTVSTVFNPEAIELKTLKSTASTALKLETSKSTASTAPKQSKDLKEIYEALYIEAESIFWNAQGEIFEDGMESRFSNQVESFIKRHSIYGVEVLTQLITQEKVNLENIGEALRWLGRLLDKESYEFRRWLLEDRAVHSSSIYVKDGAILGLASMDDKKSIGALIIAIENEKCIELKKDMELVLKQLEG